MSKLKINEYLTVAEAAKVLGISPMTLRRWDESNKFKARRHPISGYRLYLKKDLDIILRKINLKTALNKM